MQDVDNSQEEAELQCYGFFRGSIVGLQYYTGQVNQREVCYMSCILQCNSPNKMKLSVAKRPLIGLQMVKLVREANNPYDRK